MKLFLKVGCLFLLIAILSYLVPRFFVRKDIDIASADMDTLYTNALNKLSTLSSSWVTYRFVREAAQLPAVAQRVQVEKQSLREIAASVIGQDPDLAVVQVTDSGNQTAVISQESAHPYTPLWAKDQSQQLWIQIPQREKIFLAIPLQKDPTIYLLFSDAKGEEAAKTLSFTPFEEKIFSTKRETSAEQAFEAFRLKESLHLEKTKLIQELLLSERKAEGILHVDSTFERGIALVSDEIFFSNPLADTAHPSSHPFVVYRKDGPYVDLMQFATQSPPFVVIGYSLSTIASEIAKIIQKPVLLFAQTAQGSILQAFTTEGQNLPIHSLSISPEKVLWQNDTYIPENIQIGPLTFSILIPEAEKMAIQRVLHKVNYSLVSKISDNLFLLAVLLFAVSMLLLNRIAKKITKPIRQLALASEEIGKGKYEGLELPPVEKRHDEVAILSHSFQKMVISLRDREKIRGVLNKVVSKEIAATILSSSIELKGEERTLTMLFSDIRGFTPLSETLPPQQLIGLLNTYMTRMCRIIDETHGVVDKFVGDEIMALYGAPLNLESHAEKAIESALLMIADLRRWNNERGENEPRIEVGIGIHTGDAYAGNMGAEDRLNYTVVGANVNLAARLCSVATPMQILVSEETYNSLTNTEKFHFQKLPAVSLKGIDTPVPVYEVR